MHCVITAFLIACILVILWYVVIRPIHSYVNSCRVQSPVPRESFTYFDGEKEVPCELVPDEQPLEKTYLESFWEGIVRKGKVVPYRPPPKPRAPIIVKPSRNNHDVIIYATTVAVDQEEQAGTIHVATDAPQTHYVRERFGDANGGGTFNVGSRATVIDVERPNPGYQFGAWGVNGSTEISTSYYPQLRAGAPAGISAFTPDRIPVPNDHDPEFWQGRERIGASTASCGRPNAEQFTGRGECFLSQPDEAFDSVRTASTVGGPVRSVGYGKPSCHIPKDAQTFNILYGDVMGLSLHDGPAPDDCEYPGAINGYNYKEPCQKIEC